MLRFWYPCGSPLFPPIEIAGKHYKANNLPATGEKLPAWKTPFDNRKLASPDDEVEPGPQPFLAARLVISNISAGFDGLN